MSKFHISTIPHVSQVTLNVSNIQQSLSFYQAVLKFKVHPLGDTIVGLSADGINPIIVLNEVKGAKKPRTYVGLYHVALLLPSHQELGNLLNHLLNVKYPITGLADHQVSEAIYLEDPDGNGIELYADRAVPGAYNWHAYDPKTLTMPLDYQSLLKDSKGLAYENVPKETMIGHVHLHVRDLKQAQRFFVDLLGLELMFSWGDSAKFLAAAGYHHHLGINTWNGTKAQPIRPNDIGLIGYVFSIPDSQKAAIIARLNTAGYAINDDQVIDPNGVTIKLKVA